MRSGAWTASPGLGDRVAHGRAVYVYAENSDMTYVYGPFGGTIAKTGALADANPFRFSRKYLDAETDLYYYGLRSYNPVLGRWPSRDPIGENTACYNRMSAEIAEISTREAMLANLLVQVRGVGSDTGHATSEISAELRDLVQMRHDLESQRSEIEIAGNLYLFVGNNPVLFVDHLGLFICKWISEGPKTTIGAPGWKIGYYIPPEGWIGTIYLGPIKCGWTCWVKDKQKGHWRCCGHDFGSYTRTWNRRSTKSEETSGNSYYSSWGHQIVITCQNPKGSCP